jgi:hypothetical protein
MTMNRKSLLRRLYCGVSIAALLLTLSFDGSRAARAADPDALTPLLETIITPIITTVQGVEQRLARLERTVGSFADSFTSQRIATQQLCVSDDSGAQTCISKSQLDALLKIEAQIVSASLPAAAVDASTPPLADAAEITAATVSHPEQAADQTPASPTMQQAAVTVDESTETSKIGETTEDRTAKDAVPAPASEGDQQSEQTGSISPNPSSGEPSLVPDATPNGAP